MDQDEAGRKPQPDSDNDDVREDPGSENIERPAGDWSVAPDPIEPDKEGQELEDPRDSRIAQEG